MKLVSLNMEGDNHLDLIKPFLLKTKADTVCLQEAPESFQDWLQEQGYQTVFTPLLLRQRSGRTYTEGLILASKHPLNATIEYYYKSADDICVSILRDHTSEANAVIIGTITYNEVPYTIATTHLMVTKNGETDEHQEKGLERLQAILDKHPPYIICGDFNMPRGYNRLYEVMTASHSDVIPTEYKSSLDRELHRLGPIESELNAPIFSIYMVDYIFTKRPYLASDVQLQFGVSDHAAVIATINRQ